MGTSRSVDTEDWLLWCVVTSLGAQAFFFLVMKRQVYNQQVISVLHSWCVRSVWRVISLTGEPLDRPSRTCWLFKGVRGHGAGSRMPPRGIQTPAERPGKARAVGSVVCSDLRGWRPNPSPLRQGNLGQLSTSLGLSLPICAVKTATSLAPSGRVA